MMITYWSDYACPYCWIGETRLKKALTSFPHVPFELEMKAFRLDPFAGLHAEGDTQTRFARKYGISFAAAGRQIETISRMGREEGLDFNYATTLFTNTMDAHRLTKLARAEGGEEAEQKTAERLFAAYFSENRELADRDLLQKIGVECGLDPEKVTHMLNSDDFRDDVLCDEREAARYGIHIVPFFLIGSHPVSGAMSVEDLRWTIEKALAENGGRLCAQGAACGPDGCTFGD